MPFRGLVCTALTLTLAAALTGCGGDADGSDDAGSSVRVLSDKELKSVLITPAELGDGYQVDDSADDDDDDSKLGCLDELSDLDKVSDPVNDDDISIAAPSEIAFPEVLSGAASFKSVAEAEKALDKFSDIIADCHQVDTTSDDGFRFLLDVSADDDTVGAEADGQVNMNATGTLSGQGVELPMSIRFSAIRIGNQVVTVGYLNLVADITTEADSVNALALAKLVPVAAGKKPVSPDSLDLPPFEG